METGTSSIEGAIRPIAEDALRRLGADLVEVEFRREPVGWILRLYVDKQGGVTLADCQKISEVVGTILEVEDPIPHAYTLEVSSPGLTRPIQTPGDWARTIGGLVRVVTRRPLEGRQDFLGQLVDVNDNTVKLELEGEEIEIALSEIARARRELDWPRSSGTRSGKPGRRGRAAK